MSKKMKQWDLHVAGMHCPSCEVIIERKLKKVSGVEDIKVSKKKHHVSLKAPNEITIQDLQSSLKGTEYKLMLEERRSQDTRSSSTKWHDIGVALILILGAYLLMQQSSVFPSVGITENMSYGFVFFIGLVAATSTCLAVSGGLLLSLTAAFHEAFPNLKGQARYMPHIAFNMGRLVSYAVLGALIGALGSALTISTQATGLITIIASLLMIAIGVQMLHVFSFMDRFQVRMPKRWAHKLYTQSEQPTKHVALGAFGVGAATFFLPCGFTQALQLYVLAQGDPLTGAITMFIFALGTLPSFVAIGALTNMAKGREQQFLMTFAAVLIVILGIFSLPGGLTLAGVDFSLSTTGNNVNTVQLIDGVQVVHMRVEGLSYYPHQFTIKQGIPVRWVIDGESAQGCGQILTAPKIGISTMLDRNKDTIIEFTPTELGAIPFHCSMAMTTPGAQFMVVSP